MLLVFHNNIVDFYKPFFSANAITLFQVFFQLRRDRFAIVYVLVLARYDSFLKVD